MLQTAHEVEHFALVGTIFSTQRLQGCHIKGHALGQASETMLLGTFLDQAACLVGQIRHEADPLGVGVAHGGVELAQLLVGRDVVT
ncbi:hypothetical protein D9M68_751700 [compost metagenome]